MRWCIISPGNPCTKGHGTSCHWAWGNLNLSCHNIGLVLDASKNEGNVHFSLKPRGRSSFELPPCSRNDESPIEPLSRKSHARGDPLVRSGAKCATLMDVECCFLQPEINITLMYQNCYLSSIYISDNLWHMYLKAIKPKAFQPAFGFDRGLPELYFFYTASRNLDIFFYTSFCFI